MEGIKNPVVTIRRKGLDKFEGQSKGYTGWFKLNSELNFFLQLIQNSIKRFEKYIEGQDTELYKNVFLPFDKEFIKTQNVTNAPKLITQ